MPIVQNSWETVPNAPRMLKGQISNKYIGPKAVPIPGKQAQQKE